MRQRARFCAIALLLFALPCYGIPITLSGSDFPTGDDVAANLVTPEGIRVSPNCHVDLLGADGFGFDSAGCASHFNADFLGVPEFAGGPGSFAPSAVWIDYSLRAFTLASVLMPFNVEWVLRSSRGGFFSAFDAMDNEDGSPITVRFAGPQWTNVDWIMFSCDGRDCGEPFCMRFDDVTLRVPEPGMLQLFFFALASAAAFGFARRERVLRSLRRR